MALKGLAQTESLSPSQIRGRVNARFPELDRIPLRPQLDSIVVQTDLDLTWDDERGVYRVLRPGAGQRDHDAHPQTNSRARTQRRRTGYPIRSGSESRGGAEAFAR